MKNIYKYIINGLSALAIIGFSACSDDEAVTPEVQFSADQLTVFEGDTVTFTVGTNVSGLSFFSGEDGNDYLKSRAYWLANGANELIVADENTKAYKMNFSNVQTVPDSYSLEGNIVSDLEIRNGELFMSIDSLRDNHPDGNRLNILTNNAIRVGDKESETFKIHWSLPDMPLEPTAEDPETKEYAKLGVKLYLEVDGGTDILIYNGQATSVKNSYATTEYDLSTIINKYAGSNETVAIDKITIEIGSVTDAYHGTVSIKSIQVGSTLYQSFDQGKAVALISENGTTTLKHIYTTEGTYKPTVVATNVASQKGGTDYLSNRGDADYGSEYNMERLVKSVQVIVQKKPE